MTDTSLKETARTTPWGELIAEVAREGMSRTVATARNLSFRSWPYRASLSGPMPDRILSYPTDPRPASGKTAERLMGGRYAFPGGLVVADGNTPPWGLVPPNVEWAEHAHGFAWLRHFENRPRSDTKEHVRWLVASWLDECGRWHDIAWRPQVTARRLMSWFAHGRLILDGADLIWRSELLRNMGQQARHLARTAAYAKDGQPQVTAAIGLAMSGLCLPDGRRRLERGMSLLKRELGRQILEDGGHVSRNPAALLGILTDLLALKDTLVDQDWQVPDEVTDAIARLVKMLRLFRHGDGRLALFNGSTEEETGTIEAVLGRPEAKGRAAVEGSASGYQRLKAGRVLVLADTGLPPPRVYSAEAHAGCLSFEMSVGRHRLIVNCGSTALKGDDWQNASRATAAHSTLTLADKSSARFLTPHWAAHILGPRISDGPTKVDVTRNEDPATGLGLSASHNGYLKRYGLIHGRTLFVSASGKDVRGEDVLAPDKDMRTGLWRTRKRSSAVPFDLRFHLHPDVKASLARDGERALLLLPNGDGWQFRTNWPGLALEESIYLGVGGVLKRSTQIVISGTADRELSTAINWAIHQIAQN